MNRYEIKFSNGTVVTRTSVARYNYCWLATWTDKQGKEQQVSGFSTNYPQPFKPEIDTPKMHKGARKRLAEERNMGYLIESNYLVEVKEIV